MIRHTGVGLLTQQFLYTTNTSSKVQYITWLSHVQAKSTQLASTGLLPHTNNDHGNIKKSCIFTEITALEPSITFSRHSTLSLHQPCRVFVCCLFFLLIPWLLSKWRKSQFIAVFSGYFNSAVIWVFFLRINFCIRFKFQKECKY